MAKKVKVSDNPAHSGSDGSSIEVFSDTYLYTDPGGTAWCDTASLQISPANLSGMPDCPQNKCLAAVNVKPDGLKFNPPPNTASKDPELSYDLDEHPAHPDHPPEACGNAWDCYAIYQVWSGNWRLVGDAEAEQRGSVWYAVGGIDHFSIFTLVELLEDTPVVEPRTMGMVVASDFIEDELGGIAVGVIHFEDGLGQLNLRGEHRILRFNGVEPGSSDGSPPTGCTNLPDLPDRFTCLFPIDTFLEVELVEPGLVILYAPEMGYGVSLYVSEVLVH
jgi:hypothetical protein